MQDNSTVFFVKPHVTMILKRREIFLYLKEHIKNPKDFHVPFQGIFKNTPKKFWKEFYSHMEIDYPEQLEKMAEEFESYDSGIDLFLIEGYKIAERVKEITGPTLYEQNPNWTIRGYFGPYELPNTIVHCSSPEEVKKDISILKKYFLFSIL